MYGGKILRWGGFFDYADGAAGRLGRLLLLLFFGRGRGGYFLGRHEVLRTAAVYGYQFYALEADVALWPDLEAVSGFDGARVRPPAFVYGDFFSGAVAQRFHHIHCEDLRR